MKELSNIRGYLVFLICLVPLIHAQLAGDNWDVHSQLLQSFQNEMKNLEAAAHRVNSLLLNQNINSNAKQADQVAENTNAEPTTAPAPAPTPVEVKPKDKPFEVTVLTGPNIMHNGILNTKDPIPIASNKQTLGLSEFNPLMSFGPFGSLFNSLVGKPNFPAPWWKGKNVCVENSVKNGDEDKDREAQSEPQFVIFGTGSFERCRQTANKYICTTVISTPESTKTTTMTYECCQGYRREGNACVEGYNSPEAPSVSSDDSSSSNNNDNDKSETVARNNNDNDKSDTLARNNMNMFNYLNSNNFKDAKSKESKRYYEKKDEAKLDKSYSSQDDEVNGNPVWLHNYIESQKVQNMIDF